VLTAFGESAEAETLLGRISTGTDDLAAALAYAGRTDRFLERMDQLAINWVNNLWFDPAFASIRSEPAFRAWTRKVGLGEALSRAELWLAAHPPKPAEIGK
jgi:hypothetical protein